MDDKHTGYLDFKVTTNTIKRLFELCKDNKIEVRLEFCEPINSFIMDFRSYEKSLGHREVIELSEVVDSKCFDFIINQLLEKIVKEFNVKY